jgi:predicted enzyme related to lactoylglutathione lyase
MPPAPIVFFDIAGPDSGQLREFYAEMFGWEIGSDGRFTAPVVSPLPAAMRQDPAERVLYIGVDDIAAKLEQVCSMGGAVDMPRFEVPGLVVLGLFKDPAGNRLGLVEMHQGKPKIP